jgi:hypothetical protein
VKEWIIFLWTIKTPYVLGLCIIIILQCKPQWLDQLFKNNVKCLVDKFIDQINNINFIKFIEKYEYVKWFFIFIFDSIIKS